MDQLGYETVVCPYSLLGLLDGRFPKRKVIADMHCRSDHFYYWTRRGVMRTVVMPEKRVYTAILDSDGWPTLQMIRIR